MSLDLGVTNAIDKLICFNKPNNTIKKNDSDNITNETLKVYIPPIGSTNSKTESIGVHISLREEKKVQHPFLKCVDNPPNEGKPVENIGELEEKKVNYNKIIQSAGIINPIDISKIKLNFNLNDLAKELRKVPSAPSVPSVSYNQSSYEIDQSWTLMDIVSKRCPESWGPVFEQSKEDLKRINDFLLDIELSGRMWYPLKRDLFKSLELIKVHLVKFVIIGQDPFPGTNSSTGLPIAMGLSFSTDRSNKIPGSSVNIFKVLQKTVPGFIYPSHSDLSSWARQGGLLWNKCLTLDPGNPGSHKDLWAEFTTRLIQYIDKVNPNCIYVLWGNHAQQLARYTNSKNILMTSHPSGQGAHYGFNNCNHFNEINQILVSQGKTPINWNLD